MKFLAVVALLGVCLADIVYEPCVGPDGKEYTDGEKWTTSEPCAQYMCHVDPTSQQFVEVTHCPTINVTSPCALKSYPYKQYPDCCPFKECDTGSGNGGYIWNKFGHGK